MTDFGLAKMEDQQKTSRNTGDMVGTLRDMAPEIFNGKADARSEVYAVGLTLYELLTLRPAFDEKDRHQLVKQVTTLEPSRLDKLHRAIPRDLVTIVHKAIEREPEHRYPTARELAEDLRRFLAGEPVRARRAGIWERRAQVGLCAGQQWRPWLQSAFWPSSLCLQGLCGTMPSWPPRDGCSPPLLRDEHGRCAGSVGKPQYVADAGPAGGVGNLPGARF